MTHDPKSRRPIWIALGIIGGVVTLFGAPVACELYTRQTCAGIVIHNATDAQVEIGELRVGGWRAAPRTLQAKETASLFSHDEGELTIHARLGGREIVERASVRRRRILQVTIAPEGLISESRRWRTFGF